MKITEEQLNILDSFTCERLTSNESNQMLIGAFENSRGVSLVNSLKQNAWEEDLDNHKAYYVIKNESNDILLFFTLKCGSMYVPIADEELSSKYQKLDTVASLLNAYLTEN